MRAEDFMNYVDDSDPDGCWPWLLSKRGNGYGQVNIEGLVGYGRIASRASYLLFVGSIPEGMKVLHTCDNPPCVRPSHLFLGTSKDNTQDMYAKGRAGYPVSHQVGELHGGAKLKTEDVLIIRGSPLLQRELAAMFNISQTQVSQIKRGVRWSHI